MAKILVKTPITTNGRDVVLGTDGKVKYKESIVEAKARPTFEKINRQRPQALKFIIEDYNDGDGSVTSPGELKKQKANAKQ